MVAVTLTIDGTPYNSGILDLSVKLSIANYARTFKAKVRDSDRAKFIAIGQNKSCLITMAGTTVFNGVIEKKKPTENKTLELDGRDKFLQLINKYVSNKTYSAQAASAILTDMISTYVPGLSTSGIQTTSNTYNRSYKLSALRAIISELNELESFITYVDLSDVVHYESEEFVDSGKHYTAAEILSSDYEEDISEIVNQVIVVYATTLDKAVRKRNDDSIDLYGLREKIEKQKNITTEADAISYAESLLLRTSFPSEPIKNTVRLDPTRVPGEIVWMPLRVAGILTEQPFLILEAEHKLLPPQTILSVGVFKKDTADVIYEIIRKMRILEEEQISATVAITTENTVNEEIVAQIYCTVERRTIEGALVGEFIVGQKRVGQLSGSWTTLVSAQQAILTNKGIESLLRIIAQLATVPTIFDSANSHIAVGSGSATAKTTDTQLASETDRQAVAPGSPRGNGAGRLVWDFTFGDGEMLTATLREFGILNASSSGELLGKYVHGSNLSKAADEEIRVTWEIVFTGTYSASNGLNLLRDLLAGFSVDYLDSSNMSIEVNDSGNYRELVSSIAFTTTLLNEIIASIRIANPGEVATGQVITQVDTYNKTSGGIQAISTPVADITTIVTEDNIIRQKIKIKRS